MRKLVVAALILTLLLPSVLADQNETQENLYTLVVPTYYDMLFVTGSFGSGTAARLQIDLAPTAAFNFDVGAGANYDLFAQTVTTALSVDANLNNLFLGTSGIGLNVDADISYKSYTLQLGGMQGFYGFGVDPLEFDTSIELNFSPYASVGIGRIYDISRLKELQLMMRHLDIEPTAERLKQAAMVRYRRNEYLNRFTDYTTENHVAYYQHLADAFGASQKMLDLLFIDQAQAYQFEVGRYAGMQYGWELEARLRPTIDYRWYRLDPKTHFILNLDLMGRYAAFAMDEQLYYYARVLLSPGMLSDGSTSFIFTTNVLGQVRYLPPNVPWYVDGSLSIDFDTTQATRKFQLNLGGRFNYMIHPLFIAYAGLELAVNDSFTTQSLLAFTAGGTIRLR